MFACAKINIVGGGRLTIYDPNSNTWEQRAEKSVHRISAAMTVFCGKVVVSGGVLIERSHHPTNTVECYDHASNAWLPMPPMLEGRNSHGSVSIRSKLYIISNHDQVCEQFDFFSNVFVRVQNSMPNNYLMSTDVNCVSIGNNIIAFIGFSLEKYVVYDTEKQEWSEMFENTFVRKYNLNCSCMKLPVF